MFFYVGKIIATKAPDWDWWGVWFLCSHKGTRPWLAMKPESLKRKCF